MRRWVVGGLVLGVVISTAMLGPWRAMAASPYPAEIARYFTPVDFARGQAYMEGRYWLAAAGIALRLGFLLVLVCTPTSAALRSLVLRRCHGRQALATALYLAALALGYELLILPLQYYAGFVREHVFHLSTQSQAAWFLDWSKAGLLLMALVVFLGSALVALWRHSPDRWALWAWAGCGGATVVLVALAPLIIDPLFNTFRPLTDPVLQQRVVALAAKAGLHVDRVYVSDASRRTTAENAYFTGLGATKRVVLYDTLLQHNDPDAVATVIGHELGHWRHGDIWRGIGWSVLGLAVCFWCAARVLAWAGRNRRFHLTSPADMAAVPLVLLVFFVLNLVSLPLQNAISRRMERAADRTALELTNDPAAFIRSEVQLARAGLADLAPPRPVVLLLYTHPPTIERIHMAEAFAATDGATR